MSPALGIALLCALLTPALGQRTDAVLRLSKGVLSDGEHLCPHQQDPGHGNHQGPWGVDTTVPAQPDPPGRGGESHMEVKSMRLHVKPPQTGVISLCN